MRSLDENAARLASRELSVDYSGKKAARRYAARLPSNFSRTRRLQSNAR